IAQTSVEAGYHQEIYQLATHDALSGLYNRRHFSETLDHEIARAHRHGHLLSLCIVDVDLFKSINDTFGHLAGDDVLRRIAGVIRGHVHGGDLAARIGGEEFAVLLPESDLAAAVAFADRLRAAVAATGFESCGAPRSITISIGVAAAATPAADGAALMAAADTALYRAKETGRDRVCFAPWARGGTPPATAARHPRDPGGDAGQRWHHRGPGGCVPRSEAAISPRGQAAPRDTAPGTCPRSIVRPRPSRRGCRRGNARRGRPATGRPSARIPPSPPAPTSAPGSARPAAQAPGPGSSNPWRGRWGNCRWPRARSTPTVPAGRAKTGAWWRGSAARNRRWPPRQTGPGA